MRNRTSSSGRRQFSVENAYTVNHSRPSSSAPSTASNSASSPAACPSVRFNPRCVAHRPLPSITAATCAGHAIGIDPRQLARRPKAGEGIHGLQATGGRVIGRSVRERLNRLRTRWPWFDVTMAVQDRYNELEGSMVAAAVTLSIFISLFPALLVGTAIVGFIAQGHVDLSGQIIDKLGLSGNAADTLPGGRWDRRAQPQDGVDRGPRRPRVVVTRRRAGHSAGGRSRVAGEGRGDPRPGEGARMAARNRRDDRGNHRRHRADRVGATRVGRHRS